MGHDTSNCPTCLGTGAVNTREIETEIAASATVLLSELRTACANGRARQIRTGSTRAVGALDDHLKGA